MTIKNSNFGKLIKLSLAITLLVQILVLTTVFANDQDEYQKVTKVEDTKDDSYLDDVSVDEEDSDETPTHPDDDVIIIDVDYDDEVLQDLEDGTGSFIYEDGEVRWFLFDVQGREMPQPRTSTGQMRAAGAIPNTSHDSRHLGDNWEVVHGLGMQRYEAWVGGSWRAAFCVQPGVWTVGTGDRPIQDGGWSGTAPTGGFHDLNAVQRETIQLILVHGYQNLSHRWSGVSGSTSSQNRQDAYVATVTAIWEVSRGWWTWQTAIPDAWDGTTPPPSQTGASGDLWRRLIAPTSSGFTTSSQDSNFRAPTGNSTRQGMYYQIRRDINDLHRLNRAPSFAARSTSNRPVHTLTWNSANQRYQIVLSDNSISNGGGTGANRGITARFLGIDVGGSLSAGGYTFERTGANAVTVWTTNPSATRTNSPSGLLRMSFTDDTPVLFWHRAGNWQNKVTGGADLSAPIAAHFAVETRVIGNLEIVKYSEINVRVPDTQFQIVGNGIDTVITTNADGVARLTNIPIGTYEVTEIYVPLPWALSEDVFTIQVTGNTNQVITNRLTVTNDFIRGSFELIKVSDGYIDDDDYSEWLLPDVEFELWKLDSENDNDEADGNVEPDEADESVHNAETGEIAVVTENLETVESDETGETNETDESDETDANNETEGATYIKTLITDEYGRIFVDGLVFGDYKLIETVAHYQHQLLSEPLFFSITYNHQHHEFEVTNYQTRTEITKLDDLLEPLEGAKFHILTYETEELIMEFTSTIETEVILALAHGIYILREVEAPYGFLPSEDIIFTVTDTEETIYIDVVNELDSSVEIATQAHVGDGTTQFFNHGDTLEMFDNIDITHTHIREGTPRAFRVYLFAVAPNGNPANDSDRTLIWESEYREYTVENILMTFRESTNVNTSQFPHGTTFFFAETAYREVLDEDGERTDWEEDYRHNWDGSDQRQMLFPRDLPQPQLPQAPQSPLLRLPQAGVEAINFALIGVGLISTGGCVYLYKRKNKRRKKIITPDKSA